MSFEFRKNSFEHLNRLKQLTEQYQIGKTYHLTTEELEFACKNAWRNSARCIGRINWENLKVKYKHVFTLLDHLKLLKKLK